MIISSLNFLLMKTFKPASKEQSWVFWADASSWCSYNGTTMLSFPSICIALQKKIIPLLSVNTCSAHKMLPERTKARLYLRTFLYFITRNDLSETHNTPMWFKKFIYQLSHVDDAWCAHPGHEGAWPDR